MKSVTVLMCLVAVVAGATVQELNIHPVPSFVTDQQPMLKGNLLEDLGPNKYTPAHEANAEFWLNLAREELVQRVQKTMNLNKAKNIIFFLGDGMSLTTATAARIRKGQLKGNPGEEDDLSFQKFPYAGLSKTYCANAQVADSACTATAYLCGVKTNFFALGVNGKTNFNNCSDSEDPANQVSSIAAWAQKAGKSTGIITTTTVTHASPSGAYAHTTNRMWECDADIPMWGDHNDPKQCTDIAQQLVTQEPGRNFDLIMGGGMGKFLPNTIKDLHGNMGQRLDGRNLLSTWQGMHPGGLVVTDRNSLLSLNVSKVTNIFGLFQSGYMDLNAVSDKTKQPSLADMTEVAIKFLKKNDNGYFVFIEGGNIDTANHANMAGLSLDETLELDKAVQKAREMTDPNETLIVVTADHSHPLSIAGYPGRGTNILGVNQHDTDDNGMRYTTLNYAAGTNQYLDAHGKRLDIESKFGKDILAIYPSYIHAQYGVHAGDDVGVFASGPYEHLFRGVIEQHAIPHLMAYAACIGDGPTMCEDNNAQD